MSSINLFVTNVIHFINVTINNIWPGESGHGGPGHNSAESTGGVEPGRAGQSSEHLRAADIPVMDTFVEDDLHLDIGQAEGAGGPEVDNEIIVEEVVLDDTGTGVMSDVSLYPEEGHETVGVAVVDEVADAGPRERPRASGHQQVLRALTRIADFPRDWIDQPETCRRCAQARRRRILRCQYHLLN